MEIERVGFLPQFREEAVAFGVGFKEEEQGIDSPPRTHVGILCHTFHALVVGRVVAVSTHHVHAATLVEGDGEQSSLVRQHLVELNLLADTQQPDGLQVFRRDVAVLVRWLGRVGREVAVGDVVETVGHVRIGYGGVFACLARGGDGRRGDVRITLAQSLTLRTQMGIECSSQQRFQGYPLFLFEIAIELLRSAPACGRHQTDDFVFGLYKHIVFVLRLKRKRPRPLMQCLGLVAY